MSRLFISHSSENDAAALAIGQWLAQQGLDDIFLDIDPQGGLVPGQRWQEALREAADRCEAVLFLVSPAWLASRWCIAEFLLAKSLHKRIFGLVVAPVALDDIPVEMAAEWQLCDLTSAIAPAHFTVILRGHPVAVAFPQPGLDLLRRGLGRAGLDPSSFAWPPPNDPARAPYRGLRALEAEDAAIFFGRDAAVVRGLDRIRGLLDAQVERTLVILGASGSGKSSFLRAGLWPRLARADTSFLPLPVIRPDVAAISGRAGLATALAAAFAAVGGTLTPGRVKARLAEEPDALGTLLDELLVQQRRRLVGIDPAAAGPAVVVSIDQAEELFNAEGAAEAAQLFSLLSTALHSEKGRHRRVLILATMRSDRYELLQANGEMAEVKRALFDLPPISPSEFKSVITGPVQRLVQSGRRFTIDPALTEQLIADSQGADSLPLLAFTLERLYADFGAENRLTLEQYDLIGRVQGSIEAGVDQALSDPGRTPAIPAARDAQFAALRAAFIPWLARIDPDSGAPLRRVARLDELPDSARGVIDRLVEARLLLADRRAGVDVVEVAHESLLRQWPALTAWLESDRDTLKLVEGIDRAAREWHANARHEAWLDHRAARLASADALANRADFQRRLGETGLDYLRACRAREDADLAAREAALVRDKARLRRVAGLVAAFGVAVVLGIGVAAYLFKVNADTQRSLDAQRYALFAELAATQRLSHNLDGALRLAVLGGQADHAGMEPRVASAARSELAAAYFQSAWRLSLAGHGGAVTAAVFSPDGKQVLTASMDGSARLFDAASGALQRSFAGTAELATAAFSPDGARVVTGGVDLTARLYDASTGAPGPVLSGHTGPVTSAAFDADGARVVTASEDGTAAVWDAASGKRLRVLRGHDRPVWRAAFSPDGSRVVTASEDGTARIWTAADGTLVTTLTGSHAGGVWSAAWSPDGRRVVTAAYDTKAVIWDAETGAALATLDLHQDWVTAAAYSADGRRVVTASQDGTARLWDVTAEDKPVSVATLAGHEGGVLAAAISPDGGTVLTASSDRTARLWDLRTGTPLTTMAGHEDKIWSAAFSPDATRVVTASQDKTARIWDAASGALVRKLEGHTSWVLYAAFSADGTRAVTASQDDTARVWDVRSGKQLVALVGHEGGVMMAEFDPAGTRIVTASFDKTARIWDAASGALVLTLRGHVGGVLSAAFSPDGRTVVTGGYDGTARLWDAASGRLLRILAGHTAGVWDAHFDPAGARIVTASEDRTVRIWDAGSGTERAVLRGHEDWVWSALFSGDGTRIVSGSQDHTARVWDAADGMEVGVLREVEGGIFFAIFSPDGERIVTASDDKLARIWNAHFTRRGSPALSAEICRTRLAGVSTLTRDEMRLVGHPDTLAQIDVCGPAP